MISKCQCQWCNGNIEFDAAEFQESGKGASQIFGQKVPCPHCGKETLLTMPLPKMIQPMSAGEKSNGRLKLIVLGVSGLLLLAVIAFVSWKFPDALDSVSIGIFHGLSAVIVLIGAVLAFVLSIFWVIFPWMVYSMLNRMNDTLEKIEANTRKP
jgi:hypothetical protein